MSNSTVTIRETKDGDFTPCRAQEENIGKKKCNHLKSSVTFEVRVNKVGRGIKTIEVSDEYERMDKRDKKQVISKFISDLAPVEDAKVDKIIEELRSIN